MQPFNSDEQDVAQVSSRLLRNHDVKIKIGLIEDFTAETQRKLIDQPEKTEKLVYFSAPLCVSTTVQIRSSRLTPMMSAQEENGGPG
ncbi:MAG: hypothetical protein ACLQVJ_02010 [Syntrophobacteraceae bacterium]